MDLDPRNCICTKVASSYRKVYLSIATLTFQAVPISLERRRPPVLPEPRPPNRLVSKLITSFNTAVIGSLEFGATWAIGAASTIDTRARKKQNWRYLEHSRCLRTLGANRIWSVARTCSES